jgi:integrase
LSVMKRGKTWYIYFRPFGGEPIGLATKAHSKFTAQGLERDILLACRSKDFSQLGVEAREACLRMFENQSLTIPRSLAGQDPEKLTLWRATEIFFQDPEIKVSATKDRYRQCLAHLIEYFGKEEPLENIWIPELKGYRISMQEKGFANATINWQMVTLSKLFTVLEQHRLVQQNPLRLLPKLSTKESQRHVYIAFTDVTRIADAVPKWFAPIIWTGYYSGMRKGEILGLTWDCVNLKQRIIYVGAKGTKERNKKRVPIHSKLLSILRGLKVRGLNNQDVFTINGQPLGKDSTKKAWDRAVVSLGFESKPNFHDLRHTFKTNCRRSKLDAEIRERILGHSQRELSVSERYGIVSNEELVEEVDKLTFEHGETKIWVEKRDRALTKCKQTVQKQEMLRCASKH